MSKSRNSTRQLVFLPLSARTYLLFNLLQFTPFYRPQLLKMAAGNQKFYISIIGASAVGKTAISTQAASSRFFQHYTPTIVDTYNIEINNQGRKTTIDVNDTMGLNDRMVVPDSLLLRKQGVIIVYALDDEESYRDARSILDDIIYEKIEPDHYPVMLVGNKSDRVYSDGEEAASDDENPQQSVRQQAEDYAREHQLMHQVCSATNHDDVMRVFTRLVEAMVTANNTSA